MKVLILHNRYRQPGGEDQVAHDEAALLRAHGVEVRQLEADNEAGLRAALDSAWSRASYEKVLALCRDFRPDVAHVHNFWMALSPSVHAACRAAGAATVQTFHNFRLLCANAVFLRGGRVCEDCLGKVPWRGIVRRCYRDSFAASAGVVRMIVANRRRGTWDRDVDAFIVLSQAARASFIAGGLPAERLHYKANFAPDPGEPQSPPSAGRTLLFAGRLSREKGVGVLLGAWRAGGLSQCGQLLIVGDGPDRAALESQAAGLDAVTFTGRKAPEAMPALFASARAVVMPSVAFEQFPRGVVEAYSQGRPVLATDGGGLGEIVPHESTGLRFAAGDQRALTEALRRILTDDALADALGLRARAEYLEKYTPERNFSELMAIYRSAVERRWQSSGSFVSSTPSGRGP